jgi:hypothetical protein
METTPWCGRGAIVIGPAFLEKQAALSRSNKSPDAHVFSWYSAAWYWPVFWYLNGLIGWFSAPAGAKGGEPDAESSRVEMDSLIVPYTILESL